MDVLRSLNSIRPTEFYKRQGKIRNPVVKSLYMAIKTGLTSSFIH
jgi:hypothetical protein